MKEKIRQRERETSNTGGSPFSEWAKNFFGIGRTITTEINRMKEEIYLQIRDDIRNNLDRLREDIDISAKQMQEIQNDKLYQFLGSRLIEQVEEIRASVQSALAELRGHVDARTSQVQDIQHEGFRRLLNETVASQLAEVRAAIMGEIAEIGTALPQEMHRQLSHVDKHISFHLSKELSLHLGGREGTPAAGQSAGVIQSRLLTLGRLLKPVSAIGLTKKRVGHSGDGGYVMLDDFEGVQFALSLGVGAEMTWDLDLANRGIEVHQFDYTIDAPPETHHLVRFHRSRISPMQAGLDHSLASAQALGKNQSCILKMDIEGDEWEVLDAATGEDFERVTQLVVEFHDFDRVERDDWYERAERVLRKLEEKFQVVHVHANNNGILMTRGNVAFPEILEVTFANRSRCLFEHFDGIFPTLLDAPNRDDLPDIMLGGFRFSETV